MKWPLQFSSIIFCVTIVQLSLFYLSVHNEVIKTRTKQEEYGSQEKARGVNLSSLL